MSLLLETNPLPRRIYPKPPIVEAVIDFRFSPEVKGKELLEAVRAEVGEQYTGEPRTQNLLAEFRVSRQEGSVSVAARNAHLITFLTSRDGLRLVGCADGRISTHVLAPYPGWELFIEQTQNVMRAVASLLGEHGINQVIVRYIDRFALPVENGIPFNELLAAMPLKPAAMPDQLNAFHFVFQTSDPEDGCAATMTLASDKPDEQGRPVLIYDLQVGMSGNPCCGTQQDEWLPIVERLHERQRDIFEGSITDPLRETFK